MAKLNKSITMQMRTVHDELVKELDRDVGDVVESTFASRYVSEDIPSNM